MLGARRGQEADVGRNLYAPISEVVRGWASALRGDRAGIDDAASGQESLLSAGLDPAPLLLMLRAEAHAHHGEGAEARDLVEQARAATEETGERDLSPRLVAFGQRLAPSNPVPTTRPAV